MDNLIENKQDLILLTNFYPYLKGEEYLESEINYLSKKFRNIIIVATMVSGTQKPTRNFPDNVKAYPSGVNHSTFGKLTMLANHFTSVISRKSRHIYSNSRSPIHKMYELYFEARAQEIYSRVERILQDELIGPGSRPLIYSYWLYITARVAAELKTKYFTTNPYTVSRAHRYDVDEIAAPLKFLPCRDFLLSTLDHIFPVSNYHVKFLQEKYPMYAQKISLRALGVKPPIIDMKLRKSIPLSKTLISVSAMRKVKRLELIIEALHLLNQRHPDLDYKWVHFGDGPEKERITKLAETKLKTSTYEFMGHCPNIQLHKWYSTHRPKLFINVSSNEGVPVSIMEAISYGIPVVATNAGGTADVVRSNENGLILPVDVTAESIMEKIYEFLIMADHVTEEFGERAVLVWENHFNANQLYEAFANEIYELSGLS